MTIKHIKRSAEGIQLIAIKSTLMLSLCVDAPGRSHQKPPEKICGMPGMNKHATGTFQPCTVPMQHCCSTSLAALDKKETQDGRVQGGALAWCVDNEL